jgi:monoamine oxidase
MLIPTSSTNDYKVFLDQCFDLRDSGRKPGKKGQIAVVGAGMAGLTAAWALQLQGYDVKIFEASNRVGGRVRTLRDGFTPGLHVEAGAMRIPSVHEVTMTLVNRLGLVCQEFADDAENTWVFVNGNLARMGEYLNGKTDFAKERNGSNLFKACMGPVKKLDKNHPNHQRLTQISLGEYLRAYMRADSNPITGEKIDPAFRLSGSDIELILLEESRANMDASLKEVLRDNEAHDDPDKKQIIGGMDNLPNAFCDKTKNMLKPNSIFFNARVRCVDLRGTHFAIKYENTTTHDSYEETSFDRVVLAAPFSSLCHVSIPPLKKDDFGRRKLQAIRSLHYENATKIAIEFDTKFWDFDNIKGGRSITDLPIRWVHYPTPDQYKENDPRGILLASYTWGEESLRWSALSEETRLQFAYENIRELHVNAFSNEDYCDTQMIAGMSYSWAEDSYSLGAFAIFPPHQEEIFADIWKEHSGIHFAGEHTSLKHAWIEGAVESGLRVAQEVDDALVSNGKSRGTTRARTH